MKPHFLFVFEIVLVGYSIFRAQSRIQEYSQVQTAHSDSDKNIRDVIAEKLMTSLIGLSNARVQNFPFRYKLHRSTYNNVLR